MARLNIGTRRRDHSPAFDKDSGAPKRHQSMELQRSRAHSSAASSSDSDRMIPEPECPRRTLLKRKDSNKSHRRIAITESADDSDSLLSDLAGLKLDPSDHERGQRPRRSPRKAAPRRNPYLTFDSLDLGEDSATGDESTDGTGDASDLSDFIVEDSASEAELRRPPRSVRKATAGPTPRRRLVQRSAMKRPPSIYKDTDDDVKVSKSTTAVIDLTSPGKTEGQGNASTTDKENQESGSDDALTGYSDNLGDALRLSHPRKGKPQEKRDRTMPPSSPTKSRLLSPTRNRTAIPASEYRQSVDEFWSQSIVDDWNSQHSPRKTPRTSGRLLPIDLSPSKSKALQGFQDSNSEDHGPSSPAGRTSRDDPPTKPSGYSSPAKPANSRRAALEAKRSFEAGKHQVAASFLAELDQIITNGEIARLSASTGGVKVEWSKTLKTTAGRARWKRERVQPTTQPASSDPVVFDSSKISNRVSDGRLPAFTAIPSVGPVKISRHHASIELAEKVIDDNDRLINVLAHEFCHLATFMISGVLDNPHGREFKRWAAKASSAFADRGVNVTTKHSYDILYKYKWACNDCGLEYKRHSKSIDPDKHICSACQGRLSQVQPPPRAKAGNVRSTDGQGLAIAQAEGKPADKGFSAFVKANFRTVKADMAIRDQLGAESHIESAIGSKIGSARDISGKGKDPTWAEVMGELARRWKMHKAEKQKQSEAADAEQPTAKTPAAKVTPETRPHFVDLSSPDDLVKPTGEFAEEPRDTPPESPSTDSGIQKAKSERSLQSVGRSPNDLARRVDEFAEDYHDTAPESSDLESDSGNSAGVTPRHN